MTLIFKKVTNVISISIAALLTLAVLTFSFSSNDVKETNASLLSQNNSFTISFADDALGNTHDNQFKKYGHNFWVDKDPSGIGWYGKTALHMMLDANMEAYGTSSFRRTNLISDAYFNNDSNGTAISNWKAYIESTWDYTEQTPIAYQYDFINGQYKDQIFPNPLNTTYPTAAAYTNSGSLVNGGIPYGAANYASNGALRIGSGANANGSNLVGNRFTIEFASDMIIESVSVDFGTFFKADYAHPDNPSWTLDNYYNANIGLRVEATSDASNLRGTTPIAKDSPVISGSNNAYLMPCRPDFPHWNSQTNQYTDEDRNAGITTWTMLDKTVREEKGYPLNRLDMHVDNSRGSIPYNTTYFDRVIIRSITVNYSIVESRHDSYVDFTARGLEQTLTPGTSTFNTEDQRYHSWDFNALNYTDNNGVTHTNSASKHAALLEDEDIASSSSSNLYLESNWDRPVEEINAIQNSAQAEATIVSDPQGNNVLTRTGSAGNYHYGNAYAPSGAIRLGAYSSDLNKTQTEPGSLTFNFAQPSIEDSTSRITALEIDFGPYIRYSADGSIATNYNRVGTGIRIINNEQTSAPSIQDRFGLGIRDSQNLVVSANERKCVFFNFLKPTYSFTIQSAMQFPNLEGAVADYGVIIESVRCFYSTTECNNIALFASDVYNAKTCLFATHTEEIDRTYASLNEEYENLAGYGLYVAESIVLSTYSQQQYIDANRDYDQISEFPSDHVNLLTKWQTIDAIYTAGAYLYGNKLVSNTGFRITTEVVVATSFIIISLTIGSYLLITRYYKKRRNSVK